MIAWQRGTWSRWWWCTKITWNKKFLWARERRVEWKIFENHDKILENHDVVLKQQNMDYRRLFSRYCDSNLTPCSSLYSNFLSKCLFCLLLFSNFSLRCMLQINYLFEIRHVHVFKFIIAQYYYVIIGCFWFLILSYGIYRWPY